MLIIMNKGVPFKVFRDSQRTALKSFDSLIRLIGLSLDDPGIRGVSFLDLSHDYRLKLPARAFQVQECLDSQREVYIQIW